LKAPESVTGQPKKETLATYLPKIVEIYQSDHLFMFYGHLFAGVININDINSLRSRRDRSRAQSFGLVEEKKPRREWGGDACYDINRYVIAQSTGYIACAYRFAIKN